MHDEEHNEERLKESADGGAQGDVRPYLRRTGVLTLIQRNYESFSKRQKLLADYILSNVESAAFQTAAQMGKAAGVSESTALRFAVTLGFEGFPQMQEALAETIVSRISVTRRMEQTYNALDRSQILDEVMETDMLLFQQTRQMISNEAFLAAVDLLENARDIYIIGLRGSAPLAQYLFFRLRLIFNHVTLVSSSSEHELLEQLVHVGEGDAVFGISFPRYSLRTLRMLEFASSRRARIMTLTDNIHSPINLYSSCVLTSACDLSTASASLTAAMGVVDALITALSVRNSAALKTNMEMLENTMRNYQTSGSDEMDLMEEGASLRFGWEKQP